MILFTRIKGNCVVGSLVGPAFFAAGGGVGDIIDKELAPSEDPLNERDNFICLQHFKLFTVAKR